MKGSKSCPQCETSVGPRTKICPQCSFAFEFKSKAVSLPTVALRQKEPIQGTPQLPDMPKGTGNGGMVILVPTGRCPVKYSGNWEEWVDGLKQHAHSRGVTYTTGVFTYWAAMEDLVDKFTDEGKKTLKQIEMIVNHEH